MPQAEAPALRKAGTAADVDIHAPEFLADPFASFAKLRRDCPVAHGEKHGGYYLLSRYEDVRAAAIDWRGYTSSVAGVTAIPIITPRTEPMLPIEIDPPRHSRYRALVNPVFSPERVEQIAPRIRREADRLLAGLAAKGEADLVPAFCVPVAVASLAAFTDLPIADADLWVGWITRMFDVRNRSAGAAAAAEMGAYVGALITARRKEPNGDFISMLLAAEIEGERLSEKEIHSFITVLFGAGFETTADGMSVMLEWLMRHPDALDRLKAEPALIASAVEEFLRYASPVQIFGRNATRDITLHDVTIPESCIVALGFAGANYDETVFEMPEEVRLDRSPNRHLAFGAGPHLCAGAGVARMEMRLTLEALTAGGASLSPDPDHPPRWKTRGDRRGLAALPARITLQ